MSEKSTMTLNLTSKEMDALEQLATEKDLSKTAVMRQALRFYQLAYERMKSGETMHFSGDEQRRIEFVGIYPRPIHSSKGRRDERMLTDNDLLCEHPHRSGLGGVQRIYRFPGGMGLSCVNAPMLHHYPFAWEIAVIRGVDDNGDFEALDYETGLTDDVEVFSTDDEANEFIARARTALSRASEGEG